MAILALNIKIPNFEPPYKRFFREIPMFGFTRKNIIKELLLSIEKFRKVKSRSSSQIHRMSLLWAGLFLQANKRRFIFLELGFIKY